MTQAAPAQCQNCGYSSRHCRQKPDETPLYVSCCRAWMCAGCRKLRNCVPPSNPPASEKLHDELRAGVPPNDGVYGRIPDPVYHSDRASLSSSGARALLPPSCPALFRQHQLAPPDPKPQYDFGHAAHKMVLGEGAQIVRVDADNWRTKEVQQKRHKAWSEDKLPLLAKDVDIAQVMAGRVYANPYAAKLLANGSAEVSGYWHDDNTGLRLRFRPDFLPDRPGRLICVDYKTSTSANPRHFEKQAADYGYHQQASWYLDGLREVEISDDAAFVFIVQQKTPPFLVSLVQLDAEALEIGRQLNRKAIDLYAKCSANNDWPGYGEGIHTASLPKWAVYQNEAVLSDAV